MKLTIRRKEDSDPEMPLLAGNAEILINDKPVEFCVRKLTFDIDGRMDDFPVVTMEIMVKEIEIDEIKLNLKGD